MRDESDALSTAHARIAELEAEIERARYAADDSAAQIERARSTVADLAAQVERARDDQADLAAQIERARLNERDLRGQLEGAGRLVGDLERQLAAARHTVADLEDQVDGARRNEDGLLRELESIRVDRLHLAERLERAASFEPGIVDRLLGRTASRFRPLPRPLVRRRRRIARRWLRGRGLEIGALHSPIEVARGVEVTYVDRCSNAELLRQYPEWSGTPMVEVDVVDDGERLDKVADRSQDFVIASHMLEHCENPLGTMRRHLAKLRPGGRLLYIVPDRRECFDAERPLTSFEHLVRDDREGPEGSRWDHYLEFSRLANRSPEGQVESIARRMMEAQASIHFHVWEDATFRDFLERARDYLGSPYRVEHFERNVVEIIAVIRSPDA